MTHTPVSRRKIVKGAAWSLPVIAAAIAVPASTASTPETGACLRFIGMNFTKKSLKVKVQNTCNTTARNVLLTINYGDHSETIPLGDITPHGHAPTEHERDYAIPADVTSVTIIAMADNADTITEQVTR